MSEQPIVPGEPLDVVPVTMRRNLGYSDDDRPCERVRLAPVDESEDDGW